MLEENLCKNNSIKLNSTCVVFAESEVIGLLAKGIPREDILIRAAASMAARIASLAARMSLTEPAVLSGGLSGIQGIAGALSAELKITVRTLKNGAYSGAIGAALSPFILS